MFHVLPVNTRARRNAIVSSHERVNKYWFNNNPVQSAYTLPGLLQSVSIKLPPNRPPRRGVKMHIRRQGKVAYRVNPQKSLTAV